MTSAHARRMLAAATMMATLAALGAVTSPAAAQEPPKDYNQRSLEVFEFKRAAPSGQERGQEIFYYKCWFCHNEFTKDIPKLEGLYTRAALISGQPVNDANVKQKLRDGGPAMPSYKYVLSDADINDVVSYLRGKCCWNSDAPPPNPRFIAR